MSRRRYICCECGRRGTWEKGWRHFLPEHLVWCSEACEDATVSRGHVGDPPHLDAAWAVIVEANPRMPKAERGGV